MADLEEHAIQRDKRWLFRLFAAVGVAMIAGLWMASHLTSGSTGSCIAESFGSAPPASASP